MYVKEFVQLWHTSRFCLRGFHLREMTRRTVGFWPENWLLEDVDFADPRSTTGIIAQIKGGIRENHR